MNGKLRIITTAFAALMLVPVGTLYRQNIEVWATSKGLDQIFSEGANIMVSNPVAPYLLALLIFLAGGAAFLWAEYFIRRKRPEKPRRMETVFHKTFSGGKVSMDWMSYKGCNFNNATLVYEGTGPFELIDCSIAPTVEVEINSAPAATAIELNQIVSDARLKIKASSPLPLLTKDSEEEKQH